MTETAHTDNPATRTAAAPSTCARTGSSTRTRTRGRRSVVLVPFVAASLALGPAMAPVGAGAAPGADAVEAARTEATAATDAREEAEARLADAADRRAGLERRTAELADADAASTAALADARRRLRELAVAAYIDGGRTELLQASLEPDEASAVSWRVGMVSGGAGEVSDAVEDFAQLQSANDPEQQSVAQALDEARSQEEQARSDVVQASARERDAGAALERAVAARAAARAATTTTTDPGTSSPRRSSAPASSSAAGLAAPRPVGGATAEEAAFLAKVRQCESRGNYSIVSSTGRYRGAYQFSVQTWQGVGGTGDPAAASPAEQDARALALLRLQGKRAWPVCSQR